MGVAAASLAGCDEILALLAGALAGMWRFRLPHRPTGTPGRRSAGILAGGMTLATAQTAQAATAVASGPAVAAATVPLWKLAVFFLKVGVVFFGGGYVLVAYIEGELVGQHWLTQRQLLDAVAIGQLTPGPMLSTVTFVGYLVGGGVAGAAVATAAILLPSFVLVALVNPLVPRLRNSPLASRFLDAVNAAAVGLMAAVTLKLMVATFGNPAGRLGIDWPGCLIALAAGGLLFRWKVAPAWLVLGGAVAGRLLGALGNLVGGCPLPPA